MELETACALLHLHNGDPVPIIRSKYHKEIRRCHPDSGNLTEEAALEMTKELNTAFHLVMNHLQGETIVFQEPGQKTWSAETRYKNSRPHPVHPSASPEGPEPSENAGSAPWPAGRNPEAFCDRTIYTVGGLFGSMGWFPEEDINDPDDFYESDFMSRPRPVSTGKYYWDPDIETFPMFLFSLHQKCKALQQTQSINPMLLHDLALEFIRPWECLRKIAEDYPGIRTMQTKEGPVFCTEGRLLLSPQTMQMLMNAGARPDNAAAGSECPELSPEIHRERIHVLLPSGGDLGHISFEEDPLYYICLMILRSDRSRFRIEPQKGSLLQSIRKGRHQSGVLLLNVRMSAPDCSDGRPENHNLEIAGMI